MLTPTRVVCLGGGYVAVKLCKTLKGAIKNGEVDLVVVDRNNFHTFHGLIAEMLVGKLQPGQIITPLRRMVKPAKLHTAEIEKIDLEKKQVVTSRMLDKREYIIDYDHLVVSVGSKDDLSRYSGIEQHTFRLKSYWDCFRIRNHILSMLELAEIETDPEEKKRLLTFVIAGGNYAGIEVATEFQEFLPHFARKSYVNIKPEEINVILVHSGEEILPELGSRYPKLVDYGRRFIDKLGVKLRMKLRMKAATPNEIVLNNDEVIPARTVISCTGNAQSPLLNSLPGERDQRGRVKTNEFLQVGDTDHIWAGGDCAAVPNPAGGTCPSLAIYAMTAGANIGENILRTINKKKLKPYSFTGLGDACALGSRKAIGHLKGIQITGLPAWLVWRMFMVIYLPTWERRVRAVLDWLTWPLIGRDIVSIQPDRKMAIENVLYEPGQTIIKEGDIGDNLYIIQSGNVEVFKNTDNEEKLVTTLNKGDHFGEIAVFKKQRRSATVRAKTKVEMLSIRQHAAEALSASLTAFNKMKS